MDVSNMTTTNEKGAMDQSKTNSKHIKVGADSLTLLKKENKGETENTSYFEKVVAEVTNATPARQIILGASSGWICGFLTIKIGKSSALAFGGGIILLQFACDKGYIKINWDKVNNSIHDVSNTIEVASQKRASWVDKLVKFAENNTTFSGGFIGGFLIGLASH